MNNKRLSSKQSSNNEDRRVFRPYLSSLEAITIIYYESYLKLAGIPSRELLESSGLPYTPFTSDYSDKKTLSGIRPSSISMTMAEVFITSKICVRPIFTA
jgi:hypothetical protein